MSNLEHEILHDVGFSVTANVHGPVEHQVQKNVLGKVTIKLDSEILYLWSEIFLQEIRYVAVESLHTCSHGIN